MSANNVLVLGATGRTGNHVVDLALRRGHRVTAFVRSPHKVARQHPLLAIVKGDALDSETLARALPGHDVVISALGPAPRDAFRPNSLLADAARSTIRAMRRAGLARLAIVSAAVLYPDPRLSFWFFRWFLRHHARDLAHMEAVVTGSDLAWTIVRPPRLIRSDAATYRTFQHSFPERAKMALGFGGVATFLLDCVEQPETVRQTIGITAR